MSSAFHQIEALTEAMRGQRKLRSPNTAAGRSEGNLFSLVTPMPNRLHLPRR